MFLSNNVFLISQVLSGIEALTCTVFFYKQVPVCHILTITGVISAARDILHYVTTNNTVLVNYTI